MTTLPHLELTPHHGVGPIRLGMARHDVRAVMAALTLPHASGDGNLDYFGKENAIQVEYVDGTASFIGISNGEHFTCAIYGIDPFDTPAPALFALLAKEAKDATAYNRSEALFRATVVTLYDADEQYDRKGGETRPVFAQLGIGDARYLAAIDAIHAGTRPSDGA